MVLAIDHVGHAVPDLEAAVAMYEDLYGLEVVHREVSERDGVREALLAVGDSYIQVLEPTRPSSPVATFLERRGPGLHHIGLAVLGVGDSLDRLRHHGARVVDEVPRVGTGGIALAFVHPKATMGALVELVER